MHPEIHHPQESPKGILGAISETIVPNEGDEHSFPVALDPRALQLGKQGFRSLEMAGTSKARDKSAVGLRGMVEPGMEPAGIFEGLEGEIEGGLAIDYGYKVVGVEFLWP